MCPRRGWERGNTRASRCDWIPEAEGGIVSHVLASPVLVPSALPCLVARQREA